MSTITTTESLGVNVWISFSNVTLNYQAVKEMVEAEGFAAYLPKPTAKKALKRATGKIQKASKHILARNISETGNKAVMGIVHESAEGDHLGYQQGTTIHLNKIDGSIVVEGAKALEVQGMYDTYKEASTGSDLRSLAIQVIRNVCLGIPKRPSGGIYFVPNDFVGQLEKLQALISRLGVGKIYIERVYNGTMEKENMWDAAKEEINKQVDSLLEQVSKVGETSSKRLGRSIASLERKDEATKEIESLMKIYEAIVGNEFEAEEMLHRISSAREVIADKVIEIEKRKDEMDA